MPSRALVLCASLRRAGRRSNDGFGISRAAPSSRARAAVAALTTFQVLVANVISVGRRSGRKAWPSTISCVAGSGPTIGIRRPIGLEPSRAMSMTQLYRGKLASLPRGRKFSWLRPQTCCKRRLLGAKCCVSPNMSPTQQFWTQLRTNPTGRNQRKRPKRRSRVDLVMKGSAVQIRSPALHPDREWGTS